MYSQNLHALTTTFLLRDAAGFLPLVQQKRSDSQNLHPSPRSRLRECNQVRHEKENIHVYNTPKFIAEVITLAASCDDDDPDRLRILRRVMLAERCAGPGGYPTLISHPGRVLLSLVPGSLESTGLQSLYQLHPLARLL